MLNFRFSLVSFIFAFGVNSAWAAEVPPEASALPEVSRQYFGYVNYSPLDLLVPSKLGLSFGYRSNLDSTLELEYLRGSISPFVLKDLGTMTDQRISLIKRNHQKGSSFHFSYGLTFFDFNLHLGDAILSRLSGGYYPSADLIEVQGLGFNVAMGNRWVFKNNVSFGVDWLSWAQPILTTKKDNAFLDYVTDQNDRDNVETAVDLISYFPRLSTLKLQVGYQF